MIQVRFVGDSHTELMLLVKSPPLDAIPPNVERAPDLLFSALKGGMALPPARAEMPAEATMAAPPPAIPAAAAASWGDSVAAIAVLRRKANPLYTMFGQSHGQAAG